MSIKLAIFCLATINANLVVSAQFTGNKVMGKPIVECEPESLSIRMATRKSFAGRVFVRGMSQDSDCMSDYTTTDPFTPKTVLSVKIPLGGCEMRRQRMLNPTGMQQSITLVVSFHPVFITKADKAFNVKCFYMDASKVLTHSLHVSMLTTRELQDQMDIPECEYRVRKGTPDGPLVRHANVGEKLIHHWRCGTNGNMGMLIRNCVVESGGGKRFPIIDSTGCPTDREVMEGITYNKGTMEEAYVETEAFKFADDVNIYFKCEITLCSKLAFLEGDSTCLGLTPPNCPSGNEIRKKRESQTLPGISIGNLTSSEERELEKNDVLDDFPSIDLVPLNEFVILDATQASQSFEDEERTDDRTENHTEHYVSERSKLSNEMREFGDCRGMFGLTYVTTGMAVIAGLVLVAFLLTATLLTLLCTRQHSPLDPFLFSKAIIQDFAKYEPPESSLVSVSR